MSKMSGGDGNNQPDEMVYLLSGRKSVKVRKDIVASISEYFKTKLKYEGKFLYFDKTLVPEHCLGQIIDYALTNQLEVNEHNVCDLFVASDYCCIDRIRAKCQDYFLQNMYKFDLEYLIYVAYINHPHLMSAICDYITHYYTHSDVKQVLLDIPAPFFIELLKNDNFSPIYYDIPAENVEYELLKLLVQYLNLNSVSKEAITQMVLAIKFEDTCNYPCKKRIFEIVESCPSLTSFPNLIKKIAEKQSKSKAFQITKVSASTRRFSRSWQQFTVPERIPADDNYRFGKLVSSGKLWKQLGFNVNIPAEDRPRCIKLIASNSKYKHFYGISIHYASGKIRTYVNSGLRQNNLEKPGFCLSENETIQAIEYGFCSEAGILNFIHFSTNFGRQIRFGSVMLKQRTYKIKAPSKQSYFHSFNSEFSPEFIGCIWVEYKEDLSNYKFKGKMPVSVAKYQANVDIFEVLVAIISVFIKIDWILLLIIIHIDVWISLGILLLSTLIPLFFMFFKAPEYIAIAVIVILFMPLLFLILYIFVMGTVFCITLLSEISGFTKFWNSRKDSPHTWKLRRTQRTNFDRDLWDT